MRLALLVATALTACGIGVAAAHGPLVVRKSGEQEVARQDAARRGVVPALDARSPSASAVRPRRLAGGDALFRPGARLGIHREEAGRRVPARGVANEREAILRGGEVERLIRGDAARAWPAARAERGALAAASVPAQDTLRMLVLLIDFLTDRSGSMTTGDGTFSQAPADTSVPPIDPTPHNRAYFDAHMRALQRYYHATTNGRLVLEWSIYPQADSAYHATDMADYGPWVLNPDAFQAAYDMFRSWVVAADTQDVSIPWAQFDRLTIFHAGSDLQSDLRGDSPNDVPTFTIGLDDALAIPVADSSFYVYGSAILPETANQDGYFAAINAVNVHEQGHNLVGWRDVYDVFSGFPVCGEWTLMDTGNLVGTTVQVGEGATARQFFAIGLLPPLADPYQRRLLYDDVPAVDEPAWGAIDSLGPPQVTQRVLRVPLTGEEYLLLENRQDDLNGDGQIVLERDEATGVILGPSSADSLEYDFLLPGRGVLAWRVDESVVNFELPGRRADDFYTINGDPERRGLILFEGDGLMDLGDFSSPFALGSPLDPFFVPNGSRLADDSRPPLVTNSRTQPHFAIEVLDSLRLTMRVRVDREWRVAGWPVKAKPPAFGLEPLLVPRGGANIVVFSGGDSAVHAVGADGAPAGLDGTALWRAASSLSPLARLDDPVEGPLLVAVSPDPEAARDTLPAGAGSELTMLRPDGTPLPGFPSRVPDSPTNGADWITAGPLVHRGSGDPVAIVGTRDGRIYACTVNAQWTPVPTSSWAPLENGGLGAAAILALAAVRGGASDGTLAAADAAGGVAMDPGPVPLEAQSLPVVSGSVGEPGWSPTLVFVQMEEGAGGSTQGSGASGGLPQLAVLDRATGRGAIYSRTLRLAELRGVDGPLAKGVAAGDLDGDGFHELVLATADGRIGVWNLSGSTTPGWPRDTDPESFVTVAAPAVAQLDAGAAPEVISASGSGRLYALDANRSPLPGWPIGTSAGQRSSPTLLDLDADGTLELLIADADSLLHAFDLAVAPAAGATWPMWGGDPQRSFSLAAAPTTGGPPAGEGLVISGSIVCSPNPAKRAPVAVSFRTRSAGRAILTLYDASGRKIEEMERPTLAADNTLVWETSGRAPGLYLGRLQVEGGGISETHLLHIGVLR